MNDQFLNNRYIQGKQIGKGTYSTVFEAVDKEKKKHVALKKIELDLKEGVPSTSLREMSILMSCKHRNIIKLIDVVHTEGLLVLVLEYMKYDLSDYIKLNNKEMHTCIISQIIKGIHYLHINNIVHRDLKPGNILIKDNGNVKIADFGLAREITSIDTPYSPEVITLWYRPPELLMGVSRYGFEVDMWSLGCIIYEICTGMPMLTGDTNEEQLNLIQNFNVQFASDYLRKYYNIPYYILKIFRLCLEKEPKKRPKSNELIKILKSFNK